MEEHWKESLEDIAKNLTGRNSKSKDRSRTLGARLDQRKGVYIDGF